MMFIKISAVHGINMDRVTNFYSGRSNSVCFYYSEGEGEGYDSIKCEDAKVSAAVMSAIFDGISRGDLLLDLTQFIAVD